MSGHSIGTTSNTKRSPGVQQQRSRFLDIQGMERGGCGKARQDHCGPRHGGMVVSYKKLWKLCKVFHCNVGDIVDFVETVDETEAK